MHKVHVYVDKQSLVDRGHVKLPSPCYPASIIQLTALVYLDNERSNRKMTL